MTLFSSMNMLSLLSVYLFQPKHKGWRMVPRKTWVSENFGPISKSRKRFLRVSKSRFLVFFCASESRIFLPTGLGFSDFFSFFVFVWFSEVEFSRVQGYTLWK